MQLGTTSRAVWPPPRESLQQKSSPPCISCHRQCVAKRNTRNTRTLPNIHAAVVSSCTRRAKSRGPVRKAARLHFAAKPIWFHDVTFFWIFFRRTTSRAILASSASTPRASPETQSRAAPLRLSRESWATRASQACVLCRVSCLQRAARVEKIMPFGRCAAGACRAHEFVPHVHASR